MSRDESDIPHASPAPHQAERRKEERHAVDSILLPFLGTRENDQGAFEYLLSNLSASGVGISIPRWLVSREHLKEGDRINLHIPFRRSERFYTRGTVMWERWDAEQEAQFCGLRMQSSLRPPYYPVYISLLQGDVHLDLQRFRSTENLIQRILKDAYLLKRGILIYLRHLVPFFYRIGEYPIEEYPELKETLLDDIRHRVESNALWLEDLYDTALREHWEQEELPVALDLGKLRETMESEVQRDLLATVFETGAVRPYLDAIYELEKKQSHLFNTLVMLYIQVL
jgi:hypothetical protein